MMAPPDPSRRALLRGLGSLGCSAAAYPFLSGITLAAAPTNNRLVVIVLRGAMDGLDVVRPVGDPDFAATRPGAAADAVDLDGFFGLHPGLSGLHPLWQAGELAFAHAVSTPYRDKRSHFDGQNMLEAGFGGDTASFAVRDGWLNRLLQEMPGVVTETAFAIGRENMRILAGDAPVANWFPGTRIRLGDAAWQLLARLYDTDPLFRDAAAEAMALSRSGAGEDTVSPGRTDKAVASFAAERLRGDTRIASFSLSGWDTHRDQARAMPDLLGRLSDVVLTLKHGLGQDWSRTAVLAITEFGRTIRLNGTGGTDHGTGGALLMAGGAVRGGRVYGDWPGLAESALYERRDLMPTADLRSYAGWAIGGLFGLDRAAVEDRVFPGLDLGTDPGAIL
jgi:uncharacterized protein (DUF1501 family)